MPLCTLCPRNCRIDRSKTTGACSVKGLKTAKASLHFGEEPCISGTDGRGAGTIFFSGCSLKCIFCQNMPISRDGYGKEITPERLGEIMLELQEKGAHNIDLVTPTHYADIIAGVLTSIKPRLHIPVVYNCGGYEKVETLKMLDGLIDIYLPDFKYASPDLAREYSSAPDYPSVAVKAIAEMYRQTGKVQVFENGMMKKGVLVRHLVLPGCRHDSMKVLDILKATVPVSDIRISLMRQYTPCGKALEIKIFQEDLPLLNITRSPITPLSLALTATRRIKKVLPSSILPNGILKAYKNKSDRNTLSDSVCRKSLYL